MHLKWQLHPPSCFIPAHSEQLFSALPSPGKGADWATLQLNCTPCLPKTAAGACGAAQSQLSPRTIFIASSRVKLGMSTCTRKGTEPMLILGSSTSSTSHELAKLAAERKLRKWWPAPGASGQQPIDSRSVLAAKDGKGEAHHSVTPHRRPAVDRGPSRGLTRNAALLHHVNTSAGTHIH